ncbi:MAG TPA: glycoside hydrolase family 71 protein [Capsulimonadaceae bacterium]|jgi:hypothetical protein
MLLSMPIRHGLACLILMAALSLSSVQSYAAASKPMVFAHYMVCFANYGNNLDAYEKEIQAAQRRGIDGFALNCGGWLSNDPQYRFRVVKFYEAAAALNSGFKLFISADFNGPLKNSDVADMINTFRSHPNQLMYDGKPVLSSFGGEILGPKRTESCAGEEMVAFVHQQGAVFVPYYYPRPNISEVPKQSHIDQVFDSFPDLDGYFYFGAAGSGPAMAESNRLLAKKWIGAGKIYMGSVTPFYRGYGGNFRLTATRGFEAMQQEWMAAIEGHATWVEIVTWNDFMESTYVGPIDTPEVVAPALKFDFRQPHVAYLDCSRYYIDWFKNGAPPKIKTDSIYYFYQLHPKALKAVIANDPTQLGRPSGADKLEDKVYVTLMLTKPAELTIYSGETSQTFPVDAGVNNIEMPFAPGPQRFVLARGKKTLIDKTGELPIQATDTSARFNFFSGEASAQ